MASQENPTSIFRALRHRNFRLFFAGQGLSLFGTWIQQTGEVWLAYRLTHSALALGVVGFASQLPTFLLSGIAGAWIDRSNKHRIVIGAQVLEMLQAFVLAALVLTHRITYPWLIVLSVFGGIFDALEIPSRQSFVVDMVEGNADLGNAIALNSTLVNLARLGGPATAGLLIGAVGEGWCFFLNGCSYLAVIVSLLLMHFKMTARVVDQHPIWQSFREGFHYAAQSVPIRTLIITLAMVSMMASSYSVLIPIFAAQVLHGDAHTLGFLMAASGAGAMTAAIYLARRKSVIGLGRVIATGVGVLGIALIAFSFSHVFWLSWLCMLCGGFGMMLGTSSINIMLQTIVDPDKRGRVMAFFVTAFVGMAPMGNFFGGWMADHVGAPISVRIAGTVCLFVMTGYLWRLPKLRDHIRPVYRNLGILPPLPLPEVANALQATARIKPRG